MQVNLQSIFEPKVWKVLKKVKKNWSHELKRATSNYYENIGRQGESQTEKPLALQTWNASTTLPGRQRLSEKLTLLEPSHAR